MRVVGVVIALPEECRSLTRRRIAKGEQLTLDSGLQLFVSGAGPVQAARAATVLAGEGVSGLISWGCAGALTERLGAGDLLLPEHILAGDGSRFRLTASWRQRLLRALEPRLSIAQGHLAESARILSSAAAKRGLHGATGASAVDMESAAVARVAAQHRLPCLAVRAVADSAAMHVPEALLGALDEDGAVRPPRLLSGLVRRPRDLVDLFRLGRSFRAAMQTLARVAEFAGPAIHPRETAE